MQLEGKKVAILAGEIYEDLELWYPYHRLREEGAEVALIGVSGGPATVHSKHGYPAKVDMEADQAKTKDFDAVIVPGGYSPDHLRRCKNVIKFVKEMDQQGKLIAAICHGGWVPISADAVRGKKGTSFFAIKDDMTNAGLEWTDEEVVVDGNLVTSRTPMDLPAFLKAIINKLR